MKCKSCPHEGPESDFYKRSNGGYHGECKTCWNARTKRNQQLRQLEKTMNTTRYEMILNGQTAVARKVFDATPIGEAWSRDQIHREMNRRGQRIDAAVLDGCLKSLCDSRLIGKKNGEYQRTLPAMFESADPDGVQYFEKPATPIPLVSASDPLENPQVTEAMLLDLLMDRAILMSDSLIKLAGDIESIKKRIEARRESESAELVKLRQFREMLKEL